MADKVSHQDLIREARKEIRAIPCPRHIRRDAFDTVIDLLVAVAGYLPDCWPSERTLAAKLGKHPPNVHRTIVRAREWGLLATTPRPLEHSWRTGQAYHLVCLSEPLRAAIVRYQFQLSLDSRSKSSSSKKTDVVPPSEGLLSSALRRALDQTTQEAAVARRDPNADDFSAPPIGRDPDDLGPSLVVAAPSEDPAIRLAQVFDDQWASAKRRSRELRSIRASSRGMAIGYLRNILIPENGPEHTEAYIRAFAQAAVDGDIAFKDGQFAFERFTSWWGRDEIEDPLARAADLDYARRAIEAVRRQRGEIG